MTEPTYKVPRIIWEAFEAELRKDSRRFVENVATALKVPVEDLRKIIFPTNESYKIVLYDTEDIKECKAFIKHPGKSNFAVRCRKPSFPGDEYCSEHKHVRTSVQSSITSPQIWKPLKVPAEIPPLWYTDTKKVVDISGNVCGEYNETTGDLIFYQFESESKTIE